MKRALALLAIVWLPITAIHAGETPQLDRFGGNPAIQRDATGFFRVEQVNGRWMFITPEGHGCLALGANHIGKFMDAQAAELLQRFDSDEAKAGDALAQTIRDLGLNAGEAYAPFWPTLQTQMPWVANVTYPQGAANFQFDVFDLKWQAKLRAHVVRECQAIADNPLVIGVAFVDQPEWGKKRLDYFRSLPEGASGKKRLQEHQGSDAEFLGVVADAHYAQLKAAVREGAPKHLFLGERFVLRKAPDAVLQALGKHVDVFCTQALILSRRRPPEWQTFQRDGWDHEFKLTGKPVLIIDWAAPFSLGEAFDSEHGRIKTEAEAAEDSAKWITDALAHPGIVGVFRCQLIGTHGNDRWFEGKAKRTYLRDDGTPLPIMAARVREANQSALNAAYETTAAAPAAVKNTPWALGVTNGRQCLLTPAGKPFMILGLSHAGGAWQSDDGKLTAEERAKRLATLKQDLRGLRFNAVGYVPELVSEFAYIHNADRLLGSPGTVTGKGQIVAKNQHLYQDVFDPAFKARLKKQIQDICAKTVGDANCIGYWWTDIPVWRLDRQKQMFGTSYVDFIRDLPESAPGRIRYEQYKKENGGGDDAGFLVLIARELYTATAESYRQFAPGRLLFGERYNTIPGAPLEIIAECGKVVDVVSFQPYEKTLSGETLDKVHALTGNPIMLSDWNLSFPVGRYTNTIWPQFPDESAAAKGYEAYLISAFAKPYILGYYKCQYRDAVLASGQLKPGLRDQNGKRHESWAQSIARIHQSLLDNLEMKSK